MQGSEIQCDVMYAFSESMPFLNQSLVEKLKMCGDDDLQTEAKGIWLQSHEHVHNV